MADNFPTFAFTTQEDWYGELSFRSAEDGGPLSLAGRQFQMHITPATSGAAAVEPVYIIGMSPDGLSLKEGDPSTLIFRFPKSEARNYDRREYTADIIELVSGSQYLFMPVRVQYSDPSGLRAYLSRFLGVSVSFAARKQPIVTPVAVAGREGKPGATIITGTAAPVPADGREGDFYIEDRTATGRGRRMWGPKTGGVWPGTPWNIQVAGISDVPGLPDAIEGRAERAANLSDLADKDAARDALKAVSKTLAGIGDLPERDTIDKIDERRTLLDFVPKEHRVGVVLRTIADTVDLSDAMAKANAYFQETGRLVITGGRYPYKISPNWARNDGKITIEGQVTFRYTGTGTAVVIDAGPVTSTTDPQTGEVTYSAPNIFCMSIGSPDNKLIVEAPSTAQDGVITRGIHASVLCFDVRGCGSNSAGLRVIFGVCTDYYYRCSVNGNGWYKGARPKYGLITERRTGDPVDFSAPSFIRFLGLIIEGTARGAEVTSGGGIRFIEGTIEACIEYGLDLTAGAELTVVQGTDFEANAGFDIRDNGNGNSLIDVQAIARAPNGSATSGVIVGATSKGLNIVRGQYNTIIALTGAQKGKIRDIRYNIYGDGQISEAAGAGSVFEIKSALNVTDNTIHDAIPGRKVLTDLPNTTTPQTAYSYTNITRNPQVVTITGGDNLSLGFMNKTGIAAGINPTGLMRLDPGEGFLAEYTSKPTIAICT